MAKLVPRRREIKFKEFWAYSRESSLRSTGNPEFLKLTEASWKERNLKGGNVDGLKYNPLKIGDEVIKFIEEALPVNQASF